MAIKALFGLILLEMIVLIVLIVFLKRKNSQKIKDIKISYDSSAKTKFKIISKKKFSLKEVKPEQWVIIGLYVVLVIFVFYILASNYLPNLMGPINSGTYELNLNNPAKLSALYFTKNIFGDVENEGIIVNSEEIVDLVFRPKKIIPGGTKATIEIKGINKGTEVYFDNKLIIPDLTNYKKIKEFDNEEIWVLNDFDYGNLVEKDKVEDYIYFNFPGSSVYSFKELDKGIPILTDWKATITEIDTTFRDNLKLAVYHGGGNLEIEFTKQDLNSYVGKDEYTLTITDLDGEKYYEEVYEDDGEKKDSKVLGEEDDYELNLNLERGIYYLSFVKDKNNPSSDSTLKNLKIGSNKVLIVGNMLVYEKNQKFFTRANTEKEIKFYYWWTNKFQHIYFTGDLRKTFNINEDYKSKDYVIKLETGDYYFRIEKGYIWVKGDYFSLNENSWFDIPTLGESKLINNDVLIIDKNWLRIDGENVSAKINIEIKDETSKYKFQILDAEKFSIQKLTLEI